MADLFDVVIVNDRAHSTGGASKVALQSAIGLAGRGHRVSLIAAQGPIDPAVARANVKVDLIDQADLAGGNRIEMAAVGLWNRTAGRRLAAHLVGKPAGKTVIHVHSWSKALSPSVFVAAWQSGHPVIATLHDYGFVCPNGALHDYGEGRPCTRRPLSPPCLTRNCDARHAAHKLWRVGRHVVLERVARAADRLALAVCVSEYSHAIMRPLLPPSLPSRVLANPIDVEDLGPAQPAASHRFIYVGRLSREKGVLLAVEAARRAGVPLALVGDGELRGEIARVNPESVCFGWLAPAEVRALIRASRGVIIPSVWRETQGMVLPEASGCGTPVIASSGTAPGAAIRDGITGLVFTNGDVDALTQAMRRAAADDALVAAMGRAAYTEYWAAPATLKRHVEELEKVYGDVLSG